MLARPKNVLTRAVALLLLAPLLCPTNAYAKVEVNGLNKPQKKNVLAWLSINRLEETAAATAVNSRHRRADKEIHKALQALGYYSPEIHRSLEITDQGWLARYQINPGTPTLVKAINIDYTGAGSTDLKDKLKATQLKDKPLEHDAYRALKDQILNDAFAAGYLDAELADSRLLVDPKNASAEIQLTLKTGKRYLFGDIVITQDFLDPEFLNRYIQIQTDDPFNADSLLALQLRLSDLDYFQTLDVSTQRRENEDPHVDVNIEATAKNPQRYQFGLGYGTDTGPRFSINNEFRRLNRRGHRLRNDLRLSEVQTSISSQYLIPTGQEIGANWSLQVRYTDEEFADSRSEDYQVGLVRTRIQGPRLWQYYMHYGQENFTIGDTRSQTELLTPGISLTIRKTDNDLNPRKAYKVFADVHGAHTSYASSNSFVQGLFQSKLIWPISQRSRLLLKGQYGSSFVGEISDMPLSERFFAGGDQSVRGYAYQSLGPKDADGNVIGGKHLTVFSVELDRLFFENYGAAMFFDYGGASDTPGELLSRGVGVGLRWRTGIGMVRVDVAHPLDDPAGGYRVHIGIGAEL